uniref:IFT52 protein n=1 Tax=Fopius arisanus TaxID=64838 RepID=A0A0C9RB99_9HYME
MNFVYPYGATLNVVQPSTVALSTGTLAIPMNRPICAYYSSPTSAGKLVVLGSSRLLTDSYVEKEQNDALRDMIFQFFQSKDQGSKNYRADDIEVKTECIKAFEVLGVNHEPLTLIRPHFETPLPPTQPSVIILFDIRVKFNHMKNFCD